MVDEAFEARYIDTTGDKDFYGFESALVEQSNADASE